MARPIQKKKSPKRIAIIGDGLTEKWYFQQLKAAEPSLRGRLAIEPKLPKASGFRHCLATAEELCAAEYDEVHCMIDYDQVLSESATEDFNSQVHRIEKKYKEQFHFYILNPCFEIWLYLHFQYSAKAFNNCKQVEKMLTVLLPGYNKTNKFWESNNVYSILREHLFFKAVENAHKLEKKRQEDHQHSPRADIFKLFVQLIPRTEEENTLLQKLFR